MKKSLIFLANFLIILSLLGLVLYLTIGGYSFIIGRLEISLHHFKKLFLIFLGTFLLRLTLLFINEGDFRQHFFSFLKLPFSKALEIKDTSELNIAKNSFLTALFLYFIFIFVQRLKVELLIFPETSRVLENLGANNIFSLIFIFFIIFFYLFWVKRNFGSDLAFWASLLFIINPGPTYCGLMRVEYNLLVLLFIVLASLFLRLKGKVYKSIFLLGLGVLAFQVITFLPPHQCIGSEELFFRTGCGGLLDGFYQTNFSFSTLSFFKERIALFSWGREGIFLLGLSLLLILWHRDKLFITILGVTFVSLIIPFFFPQDIILYFPYVSLFSLILARGIVLVLKNPVTNFYPFDRNITFVIVILSLSLCYSYTNTNLRSLPERVYEAEECHSHIGEVREDKEASTGWALVAYAERDLPEFMIYGPYRRYFSGSYQTDFRMKTNDNTQEEVLARIEVTSDAGRTILGQKNIRGVDFKENNSYQNFTIPFEQRGRKELEFRVFYYNQGELWLDKVTVSFRNK